MERKSPNHPLWIILISVIGVFVAARFVAYLMVEKQILPHWLSPNLGTFRLHHFVYGNLIILITSFLSIGLGAKINRNWLACFYGIGLGLVLDEFPLWMGYVPQLNSNVVFIPFAPIVVFAVSGIILTLLFTRRKL